MKAYFAIVLFFFSTLIFFACGSHQPVWPPDEKTHTLTIVGPSLSNTKPDKFNNTKQLNAAISQAKSMLREDIVNGNLLYKEIDALNWLTDRDKIEGLWQAVDEYYDISKKNNLKPDLKSLVKEYYRDQEFQGYLLAVRISDRMDSNLDIKPFLEGFRLMYLSEDNIVINEFYFPIEIESNVTESRLPNMVYTLAKGLEYATPSLDLMGFISIPEGCMAGTGTLSKGLCVDSLYISKYPVTKGLWESIMTDNHVSDEKRDTLPVVNVNESQINTFLEKLNENSEYTYRLPTSEEWEYACKSGSSENKYGTSTGELNESLANYTQFSKDIVSKGVVAVDKYPANQIGLFDMSGNTWEWTSDDLKKEEKPGFIGGLINRFFRESSVGVIKGGSYDSSEMQLACSYEEYSPKSIGTADIGFRLVMEP